MDPNSKNSEACDFLKGGGDMGELIRSKDWSGTALGPIESWPRSLLLSLSLVLNSRYPMFLWWGGELVNFYNDAYIPVLGARHPKALGQPAAEVWSDIWDVVGPQARAVMLEKKASWNESILLLMTRYGFTEETYFTWSYSPAMNDTGQVNGVFCACTEDTRRVIGERRLKTLRDLGERLAEAKDTAQTCRTVAAVLEDNSKDLPFAVIYLLSDDGALATLHGGTGLAGATTAAPKEVQIAGDSDVWDFSGALTTNQSQLIPDLLERHGRLTAGAWADDFTRQAVVVPLGKAGADAVPAGFLVAGVSPRLKFDDDYRAFLELVAGQIATGLANARAYQAERKRAEALAEIDRAKTVFFSNVSHEFRTPLTLILGPTEELLSGSVGETNEMQRAHLSTLRNNALRLQKLVNTMLDFARMEAGRIEAVYEPVDIGLLTRDLASTFCSAIHRAGLLYIMNCPSMDEPVYVDRDMWEKIVLNLLSNALKFTFHGMIEVSVEESEGFVVRREPFDTSAARSTQGERPFRYGASAPTHGERKLEPSAPSPSIRPHERPTQDGRGLTPIVPSSAQARIEGGAHASRLSSHIVLTVRDTGGGIPREELPRLFDRFHRVPAAQSRTQEGSGIGLALIQELVKLHGGSIQVESEFGRGTTFRVFIPKGSAHLPKDRLGTPRALSSTALGAGPFVEEALSWLPGTEPGEVLPAVRAADLVDVRLLTEPSPERILIADDNLEMRNYLKRLLETRWHITTVEDGARALEVARLEHPDLVLSDAMMPRLTGFELLRSLREDESTRTIPVILLSARAGEESYIEGMSAGADDYIVKPFGARELIARVNALLEVSRVRRESERTLRESDERFRLATRAGKVGIWDWDIRDNIVTWSDTLYDILGVERGGFGGTSEAFAAIVHPDDREYVRTRIERAQSEDAPYEIEFRVVRPDGSVGWIYTQASVIRDAADAPLRMVGATVDITARKQAELSLAEALDQQESLYRFLERRYRAESLEELYEAALDAIIAALGCPRAAILLFDGAAKMRFVAWRGLSERYRDAVDGHSPWTREEPGPQPVCVADIGHADLGEVLTRAVFQEEGIQALAFIPIILKGRLIGRFMIYYNEPHGFDREELELSLTIARQLALGIERKQAEDALRQSERTHRILAEVGVLGARAGVAGGIKLEELIDTIAGHIADELQVSRCGLARVDLENGQVIVERDAHRGVASLAGTFALADYAEQFIEDAVAGRSTVIHDFAFDARTAARAKDVFEPIGVRACINVPLRREGRWVASFWVSSHEPRQWTDDDVQFMEIVGERVWLVLEQARIAAALAESEARYRAVVESQGEMLCRFGPDGTIRFVNEAYARAFGRSAEALRGTSLWDIVTDEDRRGVETMLDRLSPDAPEALIENRVETIHGTRWTLWTNRALAFDAQGRWTQAQSTGIDITDRKRAEEALRRSEERFRTMADSSPMMIWMTDARGGVSFLNRTYLEFFGVGPADAASFDWRQIIHPDERAAYVEGFTAALQKRETFYHRARLKRCDGEWRWFESRANPIIDEAGNMIAFIGSSADITDIYESQQALKELSQRKDEFLANMSHEIRSPLTGIMGYADILMARLKEPEDLEYLRTIKESGDYLVEIVNDILDLSKIEAGKLVLHIEPVAIHSVLAEVQGLMAARARQKKLALGLRYESAVPETVESDRTRLRQILINLLSNAVKFTEKGRVDIVARMREGVLELEVADTGIGIEPEHQQILFQPFTQADTSSTRQYGGTGLGLTITKRLVEMLGGTISLESEPGRGSTFRVTVPAGAGLADSGERRKTADADAGMPAEGSLVGQRVLVVDDREEICYLVSRYIREAGGRAEESTDGEGALEAIAAAADNDPFDAVVLDIHMPGMDGYEIVRVLRSHGFAAPIVALTAGAMVGDREKCLRAGFDGYLTKPIDRRQLVTLVAQLCRRGASRGGQTENPRVLLVDDSHNACKFLTLFLEKRGYQVRSAHDGASAIAAAREFRPGIVVLDIRLPDIDGFELMQQLKELDHGDGTTFIGLSGYREGSVSGSGKFDYYLEKPLDTAQLESILGEITA